MVERLKSAIEKARAQRVGSPAVPARAAGGSAAATLAEALANTEIREPRVPVVLNTSARATRDPAEIAEQLRRQITSPVLWQASMEALLDAGVRQFLEPAPGKQLTNMLRRYDIDTQSASCADAAALQSFTTWPAAGGDDA